MSDIADYGRGHWTEEYVSQTLLNTCQVQGSETVESMAICTCFDFSLFPEHFSPHPHCLRRAASPVAEGKSSAVRAARS